MGVETSFTPPPILTTRIAASETFGIRPIALLLANMTTLPSRRIPHHHDIPVHRALTRLHTKPTNRYRSLQLRQRTLHCVTPVHTHAEYLKFRSMINERMTGTRKLINRIVPRLTPTNTFTTHSRVNLSTTTRMFCFPNHSGRHCLWAATRMH